MKDVHKVEDNTGEGGLRGNKNAMLVRFGLSWRVKTPTSIIPSIRDADCGDFYDRYPVRELLIWGRLNYIGVFTRDVCLHPDEKTDWYKLAYHDSCWRDDGVDRFCFDFRHHLGSLQGNLSRMDDWYQIIEVPPEIEELSRENRENNKRHPLL
jgi:hypothetical protein